MALKRKEALDALIDARTAYISIQNKTYNNSGSREFFYQNSDKLLLSA